MATSGKWEERGDDERDAERKRDREARENRGRQSGRDRQINIEQSKQDDQVGSRKTILGYSKLNSVTQTALKPL